MLPIEPVVVTAHIATLSRRFSCVVITHDSYHSTTQCYSMAPCCIWVLEVEMVATHGQRAHVHFCLAAVELGPRLKRSNLEYVILQGLRFCCREGGEHFNGAAAAGPAAMARPAAALCVRVREPAAALCAF